CRLVLNADKLYLFIREVKLPKGLHAIEYSRCTISADLYTVSVDSQIVCTFFARMRFRKCKCHCGNTFARFFPMDNTLLFKQTLELNLFFRKFFCTRCNINSIADIQI